MAQIFKEKPQSLVPRFYAQLEGKVLGSSGDIIPQVSDGKFLVGITLEDTARKAIDQGYDITMVYPEDGTSAVPDGCAIVKKAPHSYNAGKFIDFVVGYDTQKYAMDTFYRRSVRTDLNKSIDMDFEQINFDIKKSASEEEEVFSLWNAFIGQKGE